MLIIDKRIHMSFDTSVLVIFQVHFLMAQNLFSNETIVQSDNQTNTTTIENRKNEDHFVPMNLNDESSTPSNCEQRDKPYFLPHTLDSSRFYVCVKGLMFLLNCPTNYQFNGENNQCVRNHSQSSHFDWDKKNNLNCSVHLEPVTPTVMPHETNCGWYYVVREEDPFERVANSCPMPQLFDSTLLECRNFTQVKCNGRFEPKDACKKRLITKKQVVYQFVIFVFRRLSDSIFCTCLSLLVHAKL